LTNLNINQKDIELGGPSSV